MKQKTNRSLEIPILNYEYKVIVCWGSEQFILKVLDSWGHDNKFYDSENNRGQTFLTRGCVPVIALKRKPTTADEIATLCHESVHAIDAIFSFIGDENRHELFAHSVGAIVRKCLGKKYL